MEPASQPARRASNVVLPAFRRSTKRIIFPVTPLSCPMASPLVSTIRNFLLFHCNQILPTKWPRSVPSASPKPEKPTLGKRAQAHARCPEWIASRKRATLNTLMPTVFSRFTCNAASPPRTTKPRSEMTRLRAANCDAKRARQRSSHASRLSSDRQARVCFQHQRPTLSALLRVAEPRRPVNAN